jgi:hypothetical protein
MTDIKTKILKALRRRDPEARICMPKDFLAIGTRAAVDQALGRLVRAGELRRVARGIYEMPRHNAYLNRPAPVDPVKVAHAIARRDNIRIMGTGMAAANMLGLTTAVSVRPEWETTGPARNVKVGGWTIRFRHARKKVAEWENRPALPVVQALYWLGPTIETDADVVRILRGRLDPETKADLAEGLNKLPDWIGNIARKVVIETPPQNDGEAV